MTKPPKPTHGRPGLDEDGQPAGTFHFERNTGKAVEECIGICRGILFDGVVTDGEITGLDHWIGSNRSYADVWPIRELHQRLRRILADGYISEDERQDFKDLLDQVTGGGGDDPSFANWATRLPVDDPPPEIVIPENEFCFTGKFIFGTRKDCELAVVDLGGRAHNNVRYATRYLVIGQVASRDWAHANFGRKIESAMNFRAKRSPVQIVAEEHWVNFL